MAFIIHRRNGEAVTGTVTLVQGNVLKLKLEKVDKSVELRFVSTAPNVLSVEEVSHNSKSDTWFFSIVAKSAGYALFKIETDSSANGSSRSPGPLQVTVEAKLSLSDENSVTGMLVRLFLLEAPSAEKQELEGIAAEDVKTAMQYMRLVLENRLRNQNEQFYCKGATNLIGVVRAPGQFGEFASYPKLPAPQQTALTMLADRMNDATQRLRPAQVAFYQTALEVATGASIADPCPTGLYGWRTAGRLSPGPRFVLFTTIGGNDFYTLKPAAK